MKTKVFVCIALFFGFGTSATAQQNKLEKDRDAIKSMCGCYEVNFNFAETFSYTDDSTYQPSPIKQTGGLEWVELVEDEKEKLVLQHLLIVGEDEDQFVIKHWRQDWLFENTDLYVYDHDNKWTYTKLSSKDVAGQWTQKVYQVDDSPRYEGSATWVHVDGKSYWENTTDAPLPRREFTQRSDYNVTVRRNRHEIIDNGWIHDQDNDKVIRSSGAQDKIIAQEKGINTYVKVDDDRCKTAQDWWSDNQTMWKEVRAAWDAVFEQDKNLALSKKVDGKRLFEILFEMEPSEANLEVINDVVTSFVK
jgi:hypothetical protein